MVSLGLWVARRRDGVSADAQAHGYARAQAALLFGWGFVCVVETVGVSVMLADLPVAHAIMLVLDVYTVLMVFELHAAAVTRPHVLGSDELRLRNGAQLDLRIPLERIASVRHDLRFAREKQGEKRAKGEKGKHGEEGDGLLEMAVGGQTSVTVELTEPVTAVRLSGRRTAVRTVRFHADDARGAVAALREAVKPASAPGAAAAPDAVGQAGATPGEEGRRHAGENQAGFTPE
ncbi:hypothetical protein [Streptomyces halobius]|uniref:Integral membrane protein n=1 Tax=Streptomyces halobius TaxID=2879846 RepID=A0ABY4MDJ1_9ACTN|nr:hypothetical protein [Streptomyces halobius]UQA95802.1 hypothetical protein K9S39_31540 [Streptomyces halobius]